MSLSLLGGVRKNVTFLVVCREVPLEEREGDGRAGRVATLW